MRRLFLLGLFLLGLFLLAGGSSRGLADAQVVQKFDGTDFTTATPKFTVQDKWEVFWFSPKPFNITLISADGTVISGVRGSFKGSFYQEKGGTFYLQLNGEHPEIQIPWHIVVAEVAGGTRLDPQDAGPMLAGPGDSAYAPPDSVLPPKDGAVAAASPSLNPLDKSSPGAPPVAPTAPGQPPVATAPTPPPVPAPTPAPNTTPIISHLSDNQARAVVLISGDKAEGTGFLTKMPDGPVVVTNLHVLANNPNVKITTSTGAQVTILSIKGAADRDLALLSIKDSGYSFLDLATDLSTIVQPGDEVITPGNSQGGEVMLNTSGRVLGLGPQRIEFDNPIYHGNSGGPIFHTKSGKVLGVVTEAMKVDTSNELDKASHDNRNSAIGGTMRYFGLRLDTVPSWVPIDWRQFQTETAFLDQFHKRSRCLDSFLNTSPKDPPPTSPDGLDPNLWSTDDKLVKANDSYIHEASGDADSSQRLEALRQLQGDLGDVADLDYKTMQDPTNFFPFDQERAREEAAYRKALKAQIESFGNDVSRMSGMARRND